MPLFAGVGAARLDRHSITDMALTKREVKDVARAYVEAIKTVAQTIRHNRYSEREPPWPGTVYFEDVSSESSFELVEEIVAIALADGSLSCN